MFSSSFRLFSDLIRTNEILLESPLLFNSSLGSFLNFLKESKDFEVSTCSEDRFFHDESGKILSKSSKIFGVRVLTL